MKKKLLFIALAVVIAVQLLVPAISIIKKYDILRTGTEYKFEVHPVDPYDMFRGRYVNFNAMTGEKGLGKYGKIAVGEDGYAIVTEVTQEKPESGDYLESKYEWFSVPFDRYYMDEELAPMADQLTGFGRKENVYVTVRIKNGKFVVSGMFIDGVAIEEFIENELNQGNTAKFSLPVAP